MDTAFGVSMHAEVRTPSTVRRRKGMPRGIPVPARTRRSRNKNPRAILAHGNGEVDDRIFSTGRRLLRPPGSELRKANYDDVSYRKYPAESPELFSKISSVRSILPYSK